MTLVLPHPTAPRALRAVLAIAGLALAMPAFAQWAWRDDNGRLVYSDRPPPAAVKPTQIVRQPGANAALLPEPVGDSATGRAGGRPAPTIGEREMEFRKRQTERAETEKKQADEQALAARKAQDCERSRGYLKALEDGVRVSRTNAQGEREFLDDEQRAAEVRRAREVISQTCS